MLEKGNVWYVRHYETYFDRVYVAYLFGGRHEPVRNGATTLISLSTGNMLRDLSLAPWRLYRLARKVHATSYLTADLVYSWWTCLLLRLWLGAKIVLMPVSMPESLYRSTGRSLSKLLPIRLERKFIAWSFKMADRVLTFTAFGAFVSWLKESYSKKLMVVDVIPESLPSSGFLEKCRCVKLDDPDDKFTLVSVSGLRSEKQVDHLVRMMSVLVGMVPNVVLKLVGDGPERPRLEQLANDLHVSDRIDFLGYVKNEELPSILSECDAFVSVVTGTALREAALCGLPIVAYDRDWIHGFLHDGENALLVPPDDYAEMARQVLRLIEDRDLRRRLSVNVKDFAWAVFSPDKLRDSLRRTFATY